MAVFHCNECNLTFTRRYNRDRHARDAHNGEGRLYDCVICAQHFPSIELLHRHIDSHPPDAEYRIVEQLYRASCTVYRKNYVPPVASLELTLLQDMDNVVRVMAREVALKKLVKFGIVTTVQFIKVENGEVVADVEHYLRSPSYVLSRYQDHAEIFLFCYQRVKTAMEDFLENGSGFILNAVYRTDLEFGRCLPLNAGCGESVSVTTRRDVKLLQMVEEEGDRELTDDCFFTAIAHHFTNSCDPAVNSHWIAHHLDVGGIRTPVDIRSVRRFEKQNERLNLRVSIIAEEEGDFYPLYVSASTTVTDMTTSPTNFVVLLLVRTCSTIDGEPRNHYVHVTSMSKLLRKAHVNGRSYYYKLYCPNCLNSFKLETALSSHMQLCMENKTQKLALPKEGARLEFTGFSKKFEVPLVGFMDFEASMQSVDNDCMRVNCAGGAAGCVHKTRVDAIQRAMTYSILIVDHLGSIVYQNTASSDDDCAGLFLNDLLDIEPKLMDLLKDKYPLRLSATEQAEFLLATECHICGKPFDRERPVKCRDHCHLTGKFMGAAHQDCNLSRRICRKVPMLCHNLSNYDSHLLVRSLSCERIHKLEALPRNTQKFRTITMNSFVFIDSMSFLDGSLADVAEDLHRSGHPFDLVDKSGMTGGGDAEAKSLLLRKGVFPYDFCKGAAHLEQTTELPPQSAFFSKVANSGVSDEDYAHARRVFDFFECQNMLQYCQLYCALDVILLAECFMSFRREVLLEFELDPCHFISLPQLAFQCMLKQTGVQLDYITDIDMILMLEGGIRGGVSFIATRHAVADERTKIIDMDANNLYGGAQACPQPTSDFAWMDPAAVAAKDWSQYSDDDEMGYILEVDLSYPAHLHEAHNSLPLAPHPQQIDESMLSPYAKRCLHHLRGEGAKHRSEKLATTFLPRLKYVVHACNLALYLSLGMKLERIHRVIQFRATRFLKSYVDFCTSKRAASQTGFRKRLFKAFSNSNFGKFIEQSRNYMDVKLVSDGDQFSKWVSSPRYVCFKVLSPTVTAIFLKLRSIQMRQMWSIGFTILERSKAMVYDSYYNKIVPALHPARCVLNMTDTDSLLMTIECPGAWSKLDIMKRLAFMMDFSNYPTSHPLYDESRRNVPGFWKDETPGYDEPVEFAGCASKAYAVRIARRSAVDAAAAAATEDEESTSVAVAAAVAAWVAPPVTSTYDLTKCKGIRKGFRRAIPFEEYRRCVLELGEHRVRQYSILSTDHVLRTVSMEKRAFCSLDDKR